MFEKIKNIKFRGKTKYNNWVYGSLINNNEPTTIMCLDKESSKLHQIQVDETTIGMFTQQYDCNGVEIYELDIVRVIDNFDKDRIGYVTFLPQECGFVLVFPNSDQRLGDRNIYEYHLEVIGNLVDNNELLWNQEYTRFREKYTTL